jgi:outer membrane protein assembly factor BamB
LGCGGLAALPGSEWDRGGGDEPEATHGFSTPVIYRPGKGPVQVIVSGSYKVTAYSLDDGAKLWWVPGMAWQAKSVPIVDGDKVYVHSWMAGAGNLGLQKAPPFDRMLKEHDANHDGELSNIPSPVLYKGVLYILREGGILTALDPAKGTVLKQGRVEGALATYYASPVAADGKIYSISQDCKMAVVKAGLEPARPKRFEG